MRPAERSAKIPFVRAGFFAPLRGLLRVHGSGARPGRRGAARLGALSVTGVVAVLAGMLLFAASPAVAAEIPRFQTKSLKMEVHSTWVRVEELLTEGKLATRWTAEYAAAEPGGKAPPAGSPAWTVVNEKEEEPSVSGGNATVYIGAEDTGFDGVEAPFRLRHLKPGTSYFVRFLARNADGEALNEKGELGETIPFTTLPVQKPALGVGQTMLLGFKGSATDTTALFKAKIETNGAVTGYSFEYALPEKGHIPVEESPLWRAHPFTSGASGSITEAKDYAIVEANVAGLTPETTYYVRVRANNKEGELVQTEFVDSNLPLAEAIADSITTLTAKPTVGVPNSFRNVTASAAQLVRTAVQPHGSKTVWRLEYATSVIGPWQDVPGAAGTISKAQAEALPYHEGILVDARLSGLLPATVYYVRMFAENEAGEGEFCYEEGGLGGIRHCEPDSTATHDVGSFETEGPPTATAFAVHALHGESLRLLGAVNPKSAPTSAEQTITVGGAPTGGSFTLTFEGKKTAAIAFDAPAEGAGSVQGALEALSGGPEVEVDGPAGGPYIVLFRLSDRGVSEPQIEASGAGLTPSGTGTVTVVTDQQGGEAYDVHYRFEYVSQRQFESEGGFAKAASTLEVDAGSGNGDEFVGYDLPSGLTPGETYRYRMVASSTLPAVVESSEQILTVPAPQPAQAPTACPNEAFRTGLSAHLPDCRAYEKLTPADKEGAQEPFNYRLETGGGVVVAEDGGHVALATETVSWGSGPGAGQSPYFFSREEGKAWRLLAGTPQPQTGVDHVEPELFSGDLTQLAFASEYRTSEVGGSPDIEYRAGPAGGPYVTVASVPRSQVGPSGGWAASSADFSKLVLQSEDRTLLGEEPTGTKSGFDLYEYTAQAGLRRLNVDSEGEPLGTCGAMIVHGSEEGAQDHTQSGAHSLSADGSRVFFQAVPGKTCSEPKHLYMRVNGTETVDIGAYRFLAANAEGTRLLLEEQTGGLHEVVLYETESKAATALFSTHSPISEGDELGVSGELSALYFFAGERLTAEAPSGSDLYRYEIPAKGMPAGTLQFLVQASEGERGYGSRVMSLSPDGRYAYFTAPEVGGLPGGGTHKEGPSVGRVTAQVYRYDSAEDVVECVSCASSFDPEPRLGASSYTGKGVFNVLPGGVTDYTPIAADGDFAFFTTPAALVPQDVDGEIEPEDGGNIRTGEYVDITDSTSPSSDIYEWRRSGVDGCAQLQGCLALITDGRGGYINLLLGTADEGRDVFIYTRSKLLPQDTDTSGDIYDARIGGGFAPPPPRPTECEGGACSTPPGAPNDQTPSSLTFSGVGNVAPEATPAPVKKKVVKKKTKKKAKKGKGKKRKAGKRARKSGERRGKR
jgi:hypothetical protein